MAPLPMSTLSDSPSRGASTPACRLAGAALLLLATAGCTQRETASVKESASSPSPVEHFTYILKRLDHALEHARPDAKSGVSSKRSYSYRLIEPQDDQEGYAAEIVIETVVRLNPRNRALTPPAEADATPRTAVKPIRQVDKQVFRLIYDGQRWTLTSPPQEELTDTERLCFQYALSDG